MTRWEERQRQFDEAYPALERAITACSIGDMGSEDRSECLKHLASVASWFRSGLRRSEDAAIRDRIFAGMSAREREVFTRNF